jgi:hypothetical protein
MNSSLPDWFRLCEETTPVVMKSVDEAVCSNGMALQVRNIPTFAYWFIKDSLFLATQANRDGMHANALSLTRQCLEALNVIELGIDLLFQLHRNLPNSAEVCGLPDAP